MATPPNNSNNILYGALYEDEEYRPWNDMLTNDHDKNNRANQRRRLGDGRSFLDGTPTWCNLRSGELSNYFLQSGTQSEATSSNLQSFKPINERNVKFQWEGRALELGLHTGCTAMTPMQDGTVVHNNVPSRDVTHKKQSTEEYPKWNLQESASTIPSCSPSHLHSMPSQRYIEQEPSGNPADQRTKPENVNNNTWECQSLYSDVQVLSFNERLKRKSYHDKPLVDRLDQFYTGIPEERRFDEATGNPWNIGSNDPKGRHGERQQTHDVVGIATSCVSNEKNDEEKSMESDHESEDLQNCANPDGCPCETDNEIGETDAHPENVEYIVEEAASSVSSGERRTKRRKRQHIQNVEEENKRKRTSRRNSKLS